MKSLIATVFGVGLVGTAIAMSPAHAATLYTQALDNSLAGRFSYSGSPGQLLADDFSIHEGGLISQVSWYGEAFFGQPFADFKIQFYSDNDGLPGASLGAATVGTPVRADAGDGYWTDALVHFTMDVSPVLAMPGVMYWISIAEEASGNFTWSSSSASGFVASSSDLGAFWSYPNFESKAFTLSGDPYVIPIPGALPLLATGLAGLGALLWRRKGSIGGATGISRIA